MADSTHFTAPINEPIIVQGPIFSPERMEAFRRATHTDHCQGMPPTLATAFRKAEFQWLDRLGIDMRQLLHTDQEYEYIEDLVADEAYMISSQIIEMKERRGLVFFTLTTNITAGEKPKVNSRTTFVVKVGT